MSMTNPTARFPSRSTHARGSSRASVTILALALAPVLALAGGGCASPPGDDDPEVVGSVEEALTGVYMLPLRADDLAVGERYSTFVHASGIQAEGKDIGARWHASDSSWPQLKSGTSDSTVLGNWVVYGKKVRAMASGTVVGCWRNAPQNVPGSYHDDFVAKKFAGGGNHLWILQDDGVYALYAHMQPGSIPAAICPNNAVLFTGTSSYGGSPDIDPAVKVVNGAHINAGQMLGLVGNSGASKQGPHLHVHMEKNGLPVVMKLERGMTTPLTGGQASLSGPWTKLSGNAMPKATILLWPPHSIGNYTFNGTPDAEYQALFDHLTDSGEMPDLITCSSNGATYNSTWIPASGQFISLAGMSATEAIVKNATFTSQGFTRTSSYTCGTANVAVWRK